MNKVFVGMIFAFLSEWMIPEKLDLCVQLLLASIVFGSSSRDISEVPKVLFVQIEQSLVTCFRTKDKNRDGLKAIILASK